MKVVLVGPPTLTDADIARVLPEGTDEIIPAGTWGTHDCILRYVNTHGIKLTEFYIEFEFFGPLAITEHFMRAIDYGDSVVIFPDSSIPESDNFIAQCEKQHKPLTVAEAGR